MWFTLSLGIVLCVIFLLDTFILVPKGVKILSKEHIFLGDKTGALTVRLKLITSKVKSGQIWRPATSMFLHAGIIHILFNLMCLCLMGSLLEPVVEWHILIMFFLSGLFSAFCMMLFTKIEDGLGASTGIFGLFGVLVVFAIQNFSWFLSQMTIAHWILLPIMLIGANLTDNLTRLEHLTGTVGGVLIGLMYIIVF